ncbi:unnamed protein product, partial [Coregonus sp. 'balchen']
GDADVEDSLASFSSWVQTTAEVSKKELLTLCFSRCQGLWMFLDHSCFTRVHLLLQRLRNLLILAQWGRRHGLGIPCVVCRVDCGSSAVRQDCWNRECRALKQHIWLDAQEIKWISQMWREIDQNHRRACLHTPGLEEEGRERWNSLIQGMVAQMDKQHRPIWTSEDCTDQGYPPLNLQALLKLVAVCAQLMYFILDMANFLQCKNDLLQSFCHAFTIPPSFSQQIRAFWLFDHGQLSHRCIIHSLLRRKQLHLALNHVSDAWALLKKGHTGSDDMVRYFLNGCEAWPMCGGFRLHGSSMEGHCTNQSEETESQCGVDGLPQRKRTTGIPMTVKEPGVPIRPFSALQNQSQNSNTLSPEDWIRLLRESMIELRQPQPTLSLTTQALRHLLPGTSPVDMMTDRLVEQGDTEPPNDDLPLIAEEKHRTPAHLSSQSQSKESSESMFSFTSASSLPPLRWGVPYVYGSTAMLQQISSLLKGVEEIMTCDIPGDYVFIVEEEAVPPVDVTLDRRHSLSRLNLHPQFYSNEDNQSVPSVSEIQVESHNFLTPDYDKMDYFKEVTEEIIHSPNVTDVWCVIPGGDKSENLLPQSSPFSGAAAASSRCFLELEPLQDSQDAVDQPEILTSCALTETTQDLLS